MPGETVLTVVGNLTADPELRVTSGGLSVLSFTIASTTRVLDRPSGQWRNGSTLFQRAVVYGTQADHGAESFKRGTRVIAHGRLTQPEFETREGDKRTVTELVVDELGASARYASISIRKAARDTEQPDSNDDPWATPWADGETATAGAR